MAMSESDRSVQMSCAQTSRQANSRKSQKTLVGPRSKRSGHIRRLKVWLQFYFCIFAAPNGIEALPGLACSLTYN